jgi:UDP-N-acetylmuramyl pentapeptide phosphotransferase/UDP-N-acetylglucosamine-1-phosphate transferase
MIAGARRAGARARGELVVNRPDALHRHRPVGARHPRGRSTHSTPVPRGGSVAILVVVLMRILASTAGGWIRGAIAVALVPFGAALAPVSWLDDRLSTQVRSQLVAGAGVFAVDKLFSCNLMLMLAVQALLQPSGRPPGSA